MGETEHKNLAEDRFYCIVGKQGNNERFDQGFISNIPISIFIHL
jgi:hypothetical protein